MTITTAVTITPVRRNSIIDGARLLMHESPLALLSCRMCGWRVDGRLDDFERSGSVSLSGVFVADAPPVVPPGDSRGIDRHDPDRPG